MVAVLVIVLALLGAANIAQTRSTINDLFRTHQEKRGISIANILAARASNLILIHNYYDLHELVKDTQKNDDDVLYAFVISNDGELLAHSFPGNFPRDLLTANMIDKSQPFQIMELQTEEGRVHDIAVPIVEGRLGIVHVGLSGAVINRILEDTTRQIVFETFAAVILGIALTIYLTRRLTMPIRDLVNATHAMTGGDFTKRVTIETDDEFGKLGKTFNAMADYVYQLLRKLQQKEEARTHLLQKVIVAQEEERKRIARELHDETGQTLTSLMMSLTYLSANCPGDHQQCQLEDMRNTVKRTLSEIHRLSVELRPSILDDMGLASAIEKYVGDYRYNYGTEIDFHVEWERVDRLSREIEITIFRIVQESLTNVAKYAMAQNISVILTADHTGLEVIIEDDGVGFDAESLMQDNATGNKLGLFGMEERAELLGGTLAIKSTIGKGTAIILQVPLEE